MSRPQSKDNSTEVTYKTGYEKYRNEGLRILARIIAYTIMTKHLDNKDKNNVGKVNNLETLGNR